MNPRHSRTPRTGGVIRRMLRREVAKLLLSLFVPAALFVITLVVLLNANLPDPAVGLCCSIPAVLAVSLLLVQLLEPFSVIRGEVADLLGRYGPYRQLLDEIDAEIDAGLPLAFVEDELPGWWGRPDFAVRTASWFLRISPHGHFAFPLAEVAWAYKEVRVEYRSFGRQGLVFAARFHLLHHPQQTARVATEEEADSLLRRLVEGKPELLTGFCGAWLDLAEEGPSALKAELARRRERFAALSEAGRENWLDDRLAELEDDVQRVDPAAADAGGAAPPDRAGGAGR